MPNLKHLLEELDELEIAPRQVKLPGPLYDEFLDQAVYSLGNSPDSPREFARGTNRRNVLYGMKR